MSSRIMHPFFKEILCKPYLQICSGTHLCFPDALESCVEAGQVVPDHEGDRLQVVGVPLKHRQLYYYLGLNIHLLIDLTILVLK